MKFNGTSFEDSCAHFKRGRVHVGASVSTEGRVFISPLGFDKSQNITPVFIHPKCIPLSSATYP